MASSRSSFGQRLKAHRLFGSLAAAVAGLLLATPVLACYSPNIGAAGLVAPYPAGKGVSGHTDVESASPPSGVAVVHPVQISSATSNDFIGWGIYKGKGATGCADNYASSWKIYADSIISGVYSCQAAFGTVAANAVNQTFQLDYDYCSLYGVYRWRLYWNGTLKACISINGTTTDLVSGGAEQVPGSASKQNLLVHYYTMQYRNSSGTWVNWPIVGICKDDPPYWVDVTGANSYWIRDR